MHKLLLGIILISASIILVPVLVEAGEPQYPPSLKPTSTSGIKQLEDQFDGKLREVRQKVEERIEGKKERVEATRTARVKNSIQVREGVFARAVSLVERILDRLQMRIDKAKEAGKDVTQMAGLMSDARAKLADAKTRLEGIKSKRGTVTDKSGFKDLQTEFQAIRRDIHGARENAARIIRELKGFNSATSSGKNSQNSTTSAVSQ